MIRRTRDVYLTSEGTLYERIDDTLGGAIDRVVSEKRSALAVVAASHSWTFVKLCPKKINFLLAACGPAVHHCS